MNELVLHLKRLNITNGKLKRKFEKFKNSMVIKRSSRSSSNLISSIPKKHSKKIETEPTRWLQSKDPWISGWIRHFN